MPQTVSSKDVEQSTAEIFELKSVHVLFTSGLVLCKNDKGKEFTVTEEGLNILKNSGNKITVLKCT